MAASSTVNVGFPQDRLTGSGRLATLAMASVWVKRELDSVALTISHRNLCWYALGYRRALSAHQPQAFAKPSRKSDRRGYELPNTRST
jgi:hypothetical protein